MSTDPLLACGHSLDSVWDTLDTAPTRHQASCACCQDARKQLTAVAQATQELRESEHTDPEMMLGPALTASIMDIARAGVRRGRKILLVDAAIGEVNISEQALTNLVRSAVGEMSELHARRCRIHVHMDKIPKEEIHGLGEGPLATNSLGITVSVATLATVTIAESVERARQLVAKHLFAALGVRVDTINITVEDIFND